MEISRIEISRKLKQLKSIVPPKETIGTKGVLLKGNTLIASNIELTVTTQLDIENDETFVIPGAAIDLIEALDCEQVTIKYEREKVVVKSKRGTSRFQTVPVGVFPDIVASFESKEEQLLFKCPGDEFAESMNKIIYASSVIEGRPIANAVNFNGKKGKKADMVCCDGHQLACLTDYECESDFDVIVPRATVQKAVSLAGNEDVYIYSPETSRIVFKMGEYNVYSSLVSGKYLDYKKAIPSEFSIEFDIDRKEITGAISRAKICADSSGRTPIRLTLSGNELIVAVNSTLSEFSETIQLEEDISASLAIGFNPNLLINALKAVAEDNITLCFNTAQTPLLIKADETLKQIVLPVRL